MKALKDCEWKVRISDNYDGRYYWIADTKNESGIEDGYFPSIDYKSKTAAKEAWKKFAELNGITNYKIED